MKPIPFEKSLRRSIKKGVRKKSRIKENNDDTINHDQTSPKIEQNTRQKNSKSRLYKNHIFIALQLIILYCISSYLTALDNSPKLFGIRGINAEQTETNRDLEITDDADRFSRYQQNSKKLARNIKKYKSYRDEFYRENSHLRKQRRQQQRFQYKNSNKYKNDQNSQNKEKSVSTGVTVNSIIARINDLENDLRTEKTERRKLEQTVNIFRNDISNLQLVGNQMKNNVKTIKSRLDLAEDERRRFSKIVATLSTNQDFDPKDLFPRNDELTAEVRVLKEELQIQSSQLDSHNSNLNKYKKMISNNQRAVKYLHSQNLNQNRKIQDQKNMLDKASQVTQNNTKNYNEIKLSLIQSEKNFRENGIKIDELQQDVSRLMGVSNAAGRSGSGSNGSQGPLSRVEQLNEIKTTIEQQMTYTMEPRLQNVDNQILSLERKQTDQSQRLKSIEDSSDSWNSQYQTLVEATRENTNRYTRITANIAENVAAIDANQNSILRQKQTIEKMTADTRALGLKVASRAEDLVNQNNLREAQLAQSKLNEKFEDSDAYKLLRRMIDTVQTSIDRFDSNLKKLKSDSVSNEDFKNFQDQARSYFQTISNLNSKFSQFDSQNLISKTSTLVKYYKQMQSDIQDLQASNDKNNQESRNNSLKEETITSDLRNLEGHIAQIRRSIGSLNGTISDNTQRAMTTFNMVNDLVSAQQDEKENRRKNPQVSSRELITVQTRLTDVEKRVSDLPTSSQMTTNIDAKLINYPTKSYLETKIREQENTLSNQLRLEYKTQIKQVARQLNVINDKADDAFNGYNNIKSQVENFNAFLNRYDNGRRFFTMEQYQEFRKKLFEEISDNFEENDDTLRNTYIPRLVVQWVWGLENLNIEANFIEITRGIRILCF